MSIWELREARRMLKAEGQKAVNADLIFDAYTRLRMLEDAARRETKQARRAAQRRRVHAHVARPPLPPAPSPTDDPVEPVDDIQPFEEIEELHG